MHTWSLDVVPLLVHLLCATVWAYPRGGPGGGGGAAKGYPVGGLPLPLSAEDSVAPQEPSCDELRTMWRLSKRQARAAEITNTIPGFKDPFAYNEWEAPAAGAGPAAPHDPASGPQLRLAVGRPVYYGKMLYAPGPQAMSFRNAEKSKAFSEYFGTPQYFPQPNIKATKNLFRLGVGGSKGGPGLMAQSTGSFAQLKDLIKKERARELYDQRLREEGKSRAQTLKQMVASKFGLVDDPYYRSRDSDPHPPTYGQVVKSVSQPSSFVNSRSAPSYMSGW
ncbi:uncharacterized protein [Bemisia tabaci]|uniref:uncharacterized protein n=1 Tax=Bemisia tabaci TaxID=7038 RepID=UPI003B289CEB